jgi:hypothetical protein
MCALRGPSASRALDASRWRPHEAAGACERAARARRGEGLVRREIVALLSLLAAAPSAVAAQVCFRPRPAPACGSFWITEVSIERRSGRLPGRALPDWVLLGGGALGGMTNLSPHWAVGAAIVVVTRGWDSAGGERANGNFGVLLRARRWLGPSVGIDLSAGLWRLFDARPAVEAAVEAEGVVALAVGARGDRLWPGRGEVYLGVRFSSYAAFAAGAAAVLRALASLGGD